VATSGGQPGNKNSAKPRRFIAALEKAIASDEGKRLRKCAEAVLDAAAAGEPWAVTELANRLDGKPAQQLIHTGDENSPIAFSEVLRKVI
jgi:hypothetical protein